MAHKFPIEMKAKLDSLERKKMFNSIKALESLGVSERMTVADIGCGTGFFTVLLARIVGLKGKVYAVDISKEMLRDVSRRIKKEGLKNVKVIVSKENKIPINSKDVDYCLLASVVHELENSTLFFKELKRLLKNNGKIGIIEWKKILSPLGPPMKERISMPAMKQILIKNRFNIEKTIGLGRYNYAVTAVKTNAKSRSHTLNGIYSTFCLPKTPLQNLCNMYNT